MAKGLPKVANYVKNAGKSLAFAAIDSVSENIEGIKDFADANNDVFKEVYAGARNYRQTMKKAHKAITENKTFVAVRTGLKNMKDDLKSGQLYHNRDYSDEIMGMDDMESDFGFTISSDDGESSSSGPSETVASTKMLSNSFDQAIGAAADAQCKTIVSGVEVVTRSHEASTKALIATQERSTAMISSSIGAVYGEVSNITKFLNTAMVTHMNNSSRFYEEQIKASQELVAMQKELLEMQRNLYAQKQQSKDTTFEDAFTATGGMNIKGYAKAIKKNVQTHVFDALGLSMLGGGGMNPLMMWAQNPWQPILSGMMGMFLPKNFKGALKGFDKSLSSAFSTFIAQANAAGKNDDGSILSFLGKIFGIDLKEKKKIDTSNYKKDAVSFDGITRQSIIETIPGYLARIEAALTGSGERYYDFQTGSWKSAKQVKAEHENRRNMNATSAGLDLQYALQPYIEEMAKLNKQSADDFRQQISAMNRQVFEDGGAFSPKKNDSYYYGMSKSNMDYLLKLGRNDPKVRAAIQGLAGNHMRARQNQNRYMEDEERNGGISRILYNHTYEGNAGPGTHGGNRAAGYGLLSLSKDADGHNVFWYLKEILKTLGNKIPAGSGRRTKAQRRKERRSRGSSSSSSSSGSSSDDGGDGESDAEEIFGDADASLWTEEELLERATKAREEEEAKKNPTKKFGDRVREKFGNTKAGQFLGAMADKFGTVISAPMEYMTKLLNKADQNLFKVFFGNEKMVDKDGNEIDSVFNYMISRVKDAFEGLSKWFKDKFDPFKDKVKEKLKPLWDKYGAPVKNAMGDMFRSGKNRVKLGFNRTIGRGMDAVGTAFNERTISVKEHEFAKKAAEIGFDEAQVYEMAKEQGITATTKFLYQQAEGSPEARKAIVALGKQYRTDISRVNTKIKARKARRDQIISELEKGGVKSAEEIKKETEGTTAGEQPATSAHGRIVTKRGLTMISPGEIIIPASTDPRELARMESLERADRAKIMNYIGLNAKGTFNTEEMKSNLYKIWEENKDPSKASRVGAGGILGAGAGLLMGNPLLGALAGAGISVLQNSETLKTMLFGEKDDEGNRKGGVIPKSVVDIFKKHGKDMGDFGIAGGLLGLLTPFGVLGGAAIGAGIGYLKNNDNFKKFVFGDAETGKDGLISKETAEKAKKFFKKSVPAMGIGAVAGMLMGPFGLLGNAVLGAGAGLLTSTSAFHKFVFGDPDNPKKGSLVGAIKNGILNPAKERIKKIFDDLTEWGKKKILDPLKNFGKELGIAIKNAVTNTFDKVKDFLNGMFEKTIGIPIHDFLQEKIFKPITKTFFNILKAPLAIGKAIIGAPFKAMGAAADHMQKKRVRTGRAGEMTAAERLQFRKDKKMGKDKFTEQDEAISQMDESQLKGIEELVKGRLKAREAAGKNLGGVRQQMGQEISSFFNEYDEGGHQLYDRVGYNKVKKIAQIAAEGDEEGAFEAIDDLKNLTPEEKSRLKNQIKGLLEKTYKENADFRKAKDELAAGDAELEKKLGRRIKGNSDLRQIQRAMADEQKARLKRAKKDGESGHEPEPPTDPAEATNLFKNIYEERTKTIIEKITESNELLKAILNPKAAAEEAKTTPGGNSAEEGKKPSTDIVPTEVKKKTADAAEDKKKQEDEEKAEEAGVDNVDPEKYAKMSIKDKLKQKALTAVNKARSAIGPAKSKIAGLLGAGSPEIVETTNKEMIPALATGPDAPQIDIKALMNQASSKFAGSKIGQKLAGVTSGVKDDIAFLKSEFAAGKAKSDAAKNADPEQFYTEAVMDKARAFGWKAEQVSDLSEEKRERIEAFCLNYMNMTEKSVFKKGRAIYLKKPNPLDTVREKVSNMLGDAKKKASASLEKAKTGMVAFAAKFKDDGAEEDGMSAEEFFKDKVMACVRSFGWMSKKPKIKSMNWFQKRGPKEKRYLKIEQEILKNLSKDEKKRFKKGKAIFFKTTLADRTSNITTSVKDAMSKATAGIAGSKLGQAVSGAVSSASNKVKGILAKDIPGLTEEEVNKRLEVLAKKDGYTLEDLPADKRFEYMIQIQEEHKNEEVSKMSFKTAAKSSIASMIDSIKESREDAFSEKILKNRPESMTEEEFIKRVEALAKKDGYTLEDVPHKKVKEYAKLIAEEAGDGKKSEKTSILTGAKTAVAGVLSKIKLPSRKKKGGSSESPAGLLPAPGSNLPVPVDPAVNAVEAVHGEDSVEAVEAKQKAEEEDAQGDRDSANHEETKNALISIKDKLFGNPKDKGKKKGGILGKIGDAMGGLFSFIGGTKVGKAIGIGAGILGGITLFGMFGDVLTDKVINPIKKLLFGNEGDSTDGLVGKIWTKASGWFKEKFPDGFGGIVRDGVQYIADNFQKVCDNVIQPIIEVLLNNAPVFIAGLVKALVSAIKNIKWGQKSVGDRTATNEYDEAAAGIAGALGRKQRTNTVEMAQATDEKGNPLYYTDETQTETTTDPTDYPVMEVVSGYTVMNTNDSIGSKMVSAGGKAFVRSAVGIGKSGVGKVMSKVSTKGVGKGVVKAATKGVGYTVKGAGASINLGQKAGDIVHDVIESTAIRQDAAKELAKASGGNADDIYKAIMKRGGDAKAIEDVAIEIAEKSGGNLTDDILEIGIKNSDNLANSAAFKSMQKTAAGATKNIMGNAADDIAEGGLKGLGKAAKNVAKNSADNVGSKIAAGLSKAFAKIGDSKIGAKILSFCGKGVSTTMLKEALEKIAQKLSKNIVGKVAGKALGKIASGIAGKIPFVAIAIWVKDFLHGFDNADTILGVAKGDTEFEVNFGHKIVCGLLELITNQFTFGLLPSEIIVDVCVEFLFPLLGLDPKGLKEARARAQEIMDEWNEAHPEEQYDNLEDFNNKDKLHVQIGKALKNTQIGEQVENVKQVGGGAIQMFKDAGSTIKNIFSGIKNGNLDETMAPLIESFKGLPKWIIAAFKNLWTSAVTGEDSEESKIADDDPLKGIKNVIHGVMKVITCPITSIVKFFAHFKENMAKMWDSLKKFGSFIWQGVKNVFIKAWDGNMLGAFSVKANQENERGLVGSLANVVFSVMKIAISPIIYITSMVGKVKNFVMDAIECGKVIIPILGTMVGQLFKKSWEGEDYEINISTTGNNMIDNVMKGVFGIVKVVTFVPRAITWAVGRIVDTVKIVIDAGKQMIPKLATAVGGLFVAAWKGEDGPDAPESTGNNVMDIINKAIFFVVKVVTFVPRALTWVVGRVVDTVKVVIDAGKQMLPKLGTAVGALFTAAWKGEESPKSPESTGNNVMDIINNVIFQVVKVLSTPLRIIVGAIGTVVSFITGGIDGLKQRLKPVTDAFDWIKEKIMGIWDGITSFFENTFGKIKSFFGGGNWGFPDVGGWISDKFGAIVDGVKEVGSKIAEGVSNAWDTVKGWFGGAGKHIYQSDPTVANRAYGPTTIGENGCAPVAATNAINNVRGKTITLNEAARHAENNGFLNKEGMTDMKYFESIFNKYGIKTQATNDSNLIMEALKHGHQVVMLGMDPQGNSNSPYGSRPHFITGVGLDNKNNIVVEDPDMPQSRVSYDPRRVLGTTLSAMVTSEKIDGQVGSGRGANALTESRRAAAAHYGSARALDSYEPAETPVVVHAKDDKSGGAGSVSYEVFLETIVNVLMQIAANTGLLAKILELLSEKLDINLNKEEVQKVVEQNTAGTKAALARIIQRSGDANAAKLIGDKDTDYLLKVMSGLASE